MEIVLDSETQEFADRSVANGDYSSVSDLVNAALRQFEVRKSEPDAREHLGPFGRQDGGPRWTPETLRQAVLIGAEQSDRGETTPFDAAAAEKIKAEGRRLLAMRSGK